MKWVTATVVLLMLAVPVQAQLTAGSVELGLDDRSETAIVEPAGWWQRVEVTFEHDGTEWQRAIPGEPMAHIVDVACGCSTTVLSEGGNLLFQFSAADPAGPQTITVLMSVDIPGAMSLPVEGGTVLIHVPEGWQVMSPQTPTSTSEDGRSLTFTGMPGERFDLGPAPEESGIPMPTVTETVTTTSGTVATAPVGFDYMALAIGLLVGMVIWALLVQRGVVQKRSRKQVANVAAHKQSAVEGKDVLEARKRVLMAGLKDLEKAKMNKEMDTSVYDKLKGELKRETVTVMRALDEIKA